jgi:hypothetical protein
MKIGASGRANENQIMLPYQYGRAKRKSTLKKKNTAGLSLQQSHS